MASEAVAYLRTVVTGAASVWFVCWAIRKRNALDYKLDAVEQASRWLIVLVGFGLIWLPGDRLAVVRMGGGFVMTAFLAWPNLAYHLMRVTRGDRDSDTRD